MWLHETGCAALFGSAHREVSEAALRATVALARGKYTGHGPGWQQNALGQVAMTMDLLAWHGLFAANLNRHFADQVLEFVLEAVIADTDETVLSKAATGRTHTRLKEPILKGSQLQNVMLSSAFTRQALQSLELAAFETWLPNARLRARRELPAEDAGGGLDDAIRNLRARWISFRPSKQCAGGMDCKMALKMLSSTA
ncbi:C3H1-type domain-containing protein [Durusdinium trenchii]|uniref:C3H1-type domain-containing protein n=1 Tax=Durusdinium trenchii TaxID=1381693 RepID=A0ABP0QCZ7_9DINO